MSLADDAGRSGNATAPDDARRSARLHAVQALLLAIERLQKRLTALYDDALEQERLSIIRWMIVSHMAMDGGKTLTHFVKALDRDSGSVSRTIHGLVHRRLLVDEGDGNDRRKLHLCLTAGGWTLHERIALRMHRLAARLDPALAPMQPEAIATLAALYARIAAAGNDSPDAVRS